MATPEDNKSVWRRFVEEVPNKGNLDAIDELVDERAVFYHPEAPEPIRGREALKEMVKGNLAAFSEVRVEIDDLIAEGDQAAGTVTITGAMQGEFMGKDVTGMQVVIQSAHFLRFSGGRIVEDRQISDGLALLAQLGLAPELA